MSVCLLNYLRMFLNNFDILKDFWSYIIYLEWIALG